MEIIRTASGKEVIIYAETIDNATRTQILRLAEHPAYQDSYIRIMPDCHAGKGCTVGMTMKITDKVTPNLVGVDIGCGMLTIELAEKEIDFSRLDAVIRQSIPNGMCVHEKAVRRFELSGLLCVANIDSVRAGLSIGTLGGGNHFIELGRSENDSRLYLVIHSGSRKLGTDVCRYYQRQAEALNVPHKEKVRKVIADLKKAGREREIQTAIRNIIEDDKELLYLQGAPFEAYLHDMRIVQEFASLNRCTIADIIIESMGLHEISRFETVHNIFTGRPPSGSIPHQCSILPWTKLRRPISRWMRLSELSPLLLKLRIS